MYEVLMGIKQLVSIIFSDFDNCHGYERQYLVLRKYTLKVLGIKRHDVFDFLRNGSESILYVYLYVDIDIK